MRADRTAPTVVANARRIGAISAMDPLCRSLGFFSKKIKTIDITHNYLAHLLHRFSHACLCGQKTFNQKGPQYRHTASRIPPSANFLGSDVCFQANGSADGSTDKTALQLTTSINLAN